VSSDDQDALPDEGSSDDQDALSDEEESTIESIELPPSPPEEESDEGEGPPSEHPTRPLNKPEFPDDELIAATVEETIQAEFGGPEDESSEQPILLAAESDEREGLGAGSESGSSEQSKLAEAYEYLDIRTPLAEFESYTRARLEAQVRVGETEEAEVTAAALKLGLDALRRVMGSLPKESNQ